MQTLGHGTYLRSHEPEQGGVYPHFFEEEVQDPAASAREGRPIFRMEERVEIVIPGDRNTCPVHRVNDDHRNRWPQLYEQFKRGLEPVLDGTPLKEWPILNKGHVRELEYFGFRRVEDLAQASDTAVQKIPGGFGLREKAKAYLDEAAELALTEKLSSENDSLRAEVSNLRRQMEEQGELLRQLHTRTLARENAPHPYDGTAPMHLDPLAGLGVPAEAGVASSLAEFDQAPVRRRGRRPKAVAAEVAETIA